MFWKTSSASHCFCFKPTTQCTFTERIFCSIVCFNVYNISKNSSESYCFCLKPTTQRNFKERMLCSIVCLNVYYVPKNLLWKPLLLLEAHAQRLSVLRESAYFVQLYVWMCIMFWKTSSESHCFCLNPTTQYTFKVIILCSIVYLNVYKVLKKFFRKPLLLIEAHHSLYFHWAHTSFNCMFECVYCFEKLLLKAIGSAWSPPLSVLPQSA